MSPPLSGEEGEVVEEVGEVRRRGGALEILHRRVEVFPEELHVAHDHAELFRDLPEEVHLLVDLPDDLVDGHGGGEGLHIGYRIGKVEVDLCLPPLCDKEGVAVEGAGNPGDHDEEEEDLCDGIGNDGEEKDPVPGVGEVGDAREVRGRRNGGGKNDLPHVGAVRDGDVRHAQRLPERSHLREEGVSPGRHLRHP